MTSLARASPLLRTSLRPSTLRKAASSSRATPSLYHLLSTLAVLEQREGKLNSSSLSAVTAALKLGGDVTGFVAGGKGIQDVAAEVAKVKGVNKVLVVESEGYEKVRDALQEL